MSWEHSNWIEKECVKERAKKLRKHIAEIGAEITLEVNVDDVDLKVSAIQKQYEFLSARLKELEHEIKRNEPHRKGGLL